MISCPQMLYSTWLGDFPRVDKEPGDLATIATPVQVDPEVEHSVSNDCCSCSGSISSSIPPASGYSAPTGCQDDYLQAVLTQPRGCDPKVVRAQGGHRSIRTRSNKAERCCRRAGPAGAAPCGHRNGAGPPQGDLATRSRYASIGFRSVPATHAPTATGACVAVPDSKV